MPTVSPSYSNERCFKSLLIWIHRSTTYAKNALKKVGIDVNANEILFKCVNQVQGRVLNTSQGKYLFQLALDRSI